jgi:hypothetical protein
MGDSHFVAHSRRNVGLSRGFPRVSRLVREHPVAVVGGGPLLDIEAVRSWPGDVWAINYTADFLLNRGIDCTFLSVDSYPHLETSAAKRLLGSNCDPSLFVGDVQVFDLAEMAPDGIKGGSSTATRAPLLALAMGYPGVVFFGCEGSFAERTHVDRDCDHTKEAGLIIVRADGRDWLTSPQMLMQCEELSWFVRNTSVFQEQSGGLLRAMVADDGWEVVGVNEAMKQHLIEVNGDQGLYDKPYRKPCPECGYTVGHYDDCPQGISPAMEVS